MESCPTDTVDTYLAKGGESTREKLIKCAMRLYYQNGINAVGLDRIISDVGVTKTTFYNHFPSKDELTIEVLRLRSRLELNQMQSEVRRIGGDDPRAQLEAVFKVMEEWFNNDTFQGCQYTNVAAEFPSPHDPIHQVAAEFKLREAEFFRELAKRAGIAKSREFITQFMVILDGCIAWRLITVDEHAATSAGDLARQLIDRYISEEPATAQK